MQTKLLLSGLALALACAQGCNADDDATDEQFDSLAQVDEGPTLQDAGRVRTTADAGADAGWDDDGELDDDEGSDEARTPRGGADGGCRKSRLGGRRGDREGRGRPRASGDGASPAIDGGIGIPGILGGDRGSR